MIVKNAPANAPTKHMADGARLPDFIIAGAQKSATTSLHYILVHHEQIFIPEGEILFFSIDDPDENPDLFFPFQNWWFHSLEEKPDIYWRWYTDHFKDAGQSQLIGEDSTTYLSSPKAAERLAKHLPDVKLIFTLRDPVARAYSHYWHQVAGQRALYSFEESIQAGSSPLIRRSQYKEQLARFLALFPRENMKFILFEHFIKNIQSSIDEVCAFLGLEHGLDVSTVPVHHNVGRVPKYPGLQLAFNRAFRRDLAASRLMRYPAGFGSSIAPSGRSFAFASRLHRKVNPLLPIKYPPMKPETKQFLEKYFARENAGLSDLIGIDVSRYWPYMK